MSSLEDDDDLHFACAGRDRTIECGIFASVGELCYDSFYERTGVVVGGKSPQKYSGEDNLRPCREEEADAYSRVVLRDGDHIWDNHVSRISVVVSPENIDHLRRDLARPDAPVLGFNAMSNMSAAEPIIDGVLYEGRSALLFGKSNTFKSFQAIDMACTVATGRGWHGLRVGKPKRVLYVATEGSRGVGHQRIPGWMEHHSIPEKERNNIDLHVEGLALDNDDDVQSLLNHCSNVAKLDAYDRGEDVFIPSKGNYSPRGAYGLIVIDIFGASMEGTETNDDTARKWVANLGKIMDEVGCATLTVAHTPWADDSRARMHSHFWGSFDTRFKARGRQRERTTTLSVERHKDAPSDGHWSFDLKEVKFTDPRGIEVSTLVPELNRGRSELGERATNDLSPKHVTALLALETACQSYGCVIDQEGYPETPVVTLDQWRDQCDGKLTTSQSPEAARKAFSRAMRHLLDNDHVNQKDDHFWKADKDV